MRGRITPLRVLGALVGVLLVTFLILEQIPSGYYLLVPDPAHPVAPLVHVAGAKPTKGSGELYFVDVLEEKASEFDKTFRDWLHPHSTLEKASDFIPPGSNDRKYQQAELRQMVTSQQTAAVVALRHLGYPVDIHENGVLVDQIYLKSDSVGKLQPSDVIVSVNGHPTLKRAALTAVMANVKPGETVKLRILRGKTTLSEAIKTVDDGHGGALIGIAASQSIKLGKLPVKVAIDSGDIGGPSAGLAFTLEVMRKLGRDVTHGYRVAATGTINLDGSVGEIGGVKQKTWGVRDAGAQVFLVPAGDNAKIAERNAGPNLKIIPVTSLDQALRALAKLPNK